MNRIFLFFMWVLLCACQENNVEKLLNFSCSEFYLVIPVHGCSGCTQKARMFARNHLDNERISYIFSDFTTTKDVRLTIGDDLYEAENVALDKENILVRKGVSEEYPSFIILLDEVIYVETLSPEIIEDRLSEIESMIKGHRTFTLSFLAFELEI